MLSLAPSTRRLACSWRVVPIGFPWDLVDDTEQRGWSRDSGCKITCMRISVAVAPRRGGLDLIQYHVARMEGLFSSRLGPSC